MKDTDQEDPLEIPPDQSQDEVRNALKITIIAVIIVILIVSISICYLWIKYIEEIDHESITTGRGLDYTLDQGWGNMTSGVLIVLQKGSGSVEIDDIRIKVAKKGEAQLTLKWPEDGNTTDYSIDSELRKDDDKWWDTTERIVFDASPELQAQNIVDGDTIEVEIINIETEEVVFSSSFTYRD
jgi:hypothetical protein